MPGSEYAYDRDHYWRNSLEDPHGWGLEDHYRYFVLNKSAHWPDPATWNRTVEGAFKDHDDKAEPPGDRWDDFSDRAVKKTLEGYRDKDELPEDLWDTVIHLERAEEINIDDEMIELGITLNPGQADVGDQHSLRVTT